MTNQNKIVYALVAVAVILAGVVGYMVWGGSSEVPAPTATAENTNPTNTTPSTNGTSTGMPPANTGSQTAFDPASAPKVPADETPEEYVRRYYQSCADGDFATAYTMLPVATQQYYGDAAAFQQTLEGYEISGFEVSPQVESGDQVTVVGTQSAQGMPFPYTWTFVKGEDGSWLCKSREMGGQ